MLQKCIRKVEGHTRQGEAEKLEPHTLYENQARVAASLSF